MLLFSLGVMAQRPPHPRPLTPLTSDILLGRIARDPRLRLVGGGISQEERIILEQKNSPAYETTRRNILARFLHAYESDLEVMERNAGDPGYKLPIRVEMVQELQAEKYNISDLNKIRAEIKPQSTGKEVAQAQRARMQAQPSTRLGRLLGKVSPLGGLFAAADVALLGVAAWKEEKNQKIRESILADAKGKICPQDPSDDYVKMLLYEEVDVQKTIMNSCHPADRVLPSQLFQKVQKERETYQKHFSTGKATCTFENGKPVIHAIGDSGTKHTIMFNKEGHFDRLRIFPQPRSNNRPSEFEGSYLEYSHFPAKQSVRYYAVRKPNNGRLGPDLDKHHMNSEPLNSFSARIHCTVEVCDQNTPEYLAIRKDESLLTTPSEPFGQITQNKRFLIQAAKTLAQFRLGIEEDHTTQADFRSVCLKLGAMPPKVPTSNGHSSPAAAPTEVAPSVR